MYIDTYRMRLPSKPKVVTIEKAWTVVHASTKTPRRSAPSRLAMTACDAKPKRRPKTLPEKAKPASLETFERYPRYSTLSASAAP